MMPVAEFAEESGSNQAVNYRVGPFIRVPE